MSTMSLSCISTPGMRARPRGIAAAAGGLLGPVLFGVILDQTGGGQSAGSWGWAFASMGIVVLAGAMLVGLLSWRRVL